MNRILLLEDDVSLVDGLVYSLKKNEFDVEVARTAVSYTHLDVYKRQGRGRYRKRG